MTAVRIAGLILAGGRSRRFAGEPKETAPLNSLTLMDHVIARARPQVSVLAVSRGDAAAPPVDGVLSIPDIYQGCGPLGGLHAGLVWSASLVPTPDFLATFACDTPLIAENLVSKLLEEIRRIGADAAIACVGDDLHPTLGLWSPALAQAAEQRLKAGALSLKGFAKDVSAAHAGFEDPDGTAFFNVNTQEDLAALKARVDKTIRK